MLEVVAAEDLLAPHVDRSAELGQLGEGLHVVEDHARGVGAPACLQVAEQRALPVAVLDLTGTVTEPVAGTKAASRCAEGTIAHQPAEQRLPLKPRQAVR